MSNLRTACECKMTKGGYLSQELRKELQVSATKVRWNKIQLTT